MTKKIYLSRRRTVIIDKKKFFRFILISVLLLNLLISLFVAPILTKADEEPIFETVTVRIGDTLWSIAEEYSGAGDVRSFVYELKKHNNLKSANLSVGQQILVPIN